MANKVETNIVVNMHSNIGQTTSQIIRQYNNLRSTMDSLQGSTKHLNSTMSESYSNISKSISKLDEINKALIKTEELTNKINSQPIDPNLRSGFEDEFDLDKELFGIDDDMLSKASPNVEELTDNLVGLGVAAKGTEVPAGKLGAGLAGLQGVALKLAPALTAVSVGLKIVNKLIDGCYKDTTKLVETMGKLASSGFQGLVNITDELMDALSGLSDKYSELVNKGADLQKEYFALYNYLGAGTGSSIANFNTDISEMFNLDQGKLMSGLRGILAVTSGFDGGSKNIEQFTQALEVMSLDLAAFSGEKVEDIMGQMERAINMNVLNSRSSLARALDLYDSDIEQFKQLNSQQERTAYLLERGVKIRGTYQKYLETPAGRLEQIVNKVNNIKNKISLIMLSLLQTIYPIVMNILSIINTLVTGFMQLFNIKMDTPAGLGGGFNKLNNGLSKVDDKIKDVGKSADKTKRQLASFDDVIQLNKNDAGAGELGGVGGTFEIPDAFDVSNLNKELTEFEKRLLRIKNLITKGKFKQAGDELAKLFRDLLNKVNWPKLITNFHNFGGALSAFLNGFNRLDLGKAIGGTFANALNTITAAVHGFLFGSPENPGGFDFNKFGQMFGAAWNNFWLKFDATSLGQTLYGVFMGIFDFVNGFLEQGSFGDMFKKIGGTIVGFFSKFTPQDIETISSSIVNLISDVFDGIDQMLNILEANGVIDKIKSLFKSILEKMAENSGDWGETINRVITGIFDTVTSVVQENKDTIAQGIYNFLDALDLFGILLSWMQMKASIISIGVEELIKKLVSTAKTSLDKGLFGGSTKQGNKAGNIAQSILSSMPGVGGIGALMGGGLVSDIFDRLNGEIENKNDSLVRTIGDNLNKILAKIKEILDPENLKKLASDAFTGLKEGIKSIWQDIKNWWNSNVAVNRTFKIPQWGGGFKDFSFSIPRLATGGVVSGSTIANIGEDGAEAVLPLEKNTGWMNILADKIASKINVGASGGGSGSVINIDMSGFSKEFYTRSEMLQFGRLVKEALELYGVNVSMVY